MSERTDTLLSLLQPYGLDPDEAQLYLDLLKNSASSALAISRRIQIGRTKVYRILDRLIEREMVTQSYNERGHMFEAVAPEKLDQLLRKQEAEITSLRQGLPDLVETLKEQTGFGREESKVLYYSGKKGLERVNFNMLRAKKDLFSYEIETANVVMDQEKAEHLRERLVEESIFIRTLTNAKKLEPFTQVTEMIRNWWEMRHLSKNDLWIKGEIFVYNDVYLVYHYTKEDVFAIEIYNQDLADMQKQQFEYLWKRAEKMKKIGVRGEVML